MSIVSSMWACGTKSRYKPCLPSERTLYAQIKIADLGNIFSGAGIAYFEDTIAAHLALMFFLPILIASGGNAGSQSATLMVRALATGDIRITITDWARVLGRELVVAALLGLSIAAAIAFIGAFRGGGISRSSSLSRWF